MRRIALALLFCLQVFSAIAEPVALSARSAPGQLCQQSIVAAAQAHGVPQALMAAIARVESGRHDPGSGAIRPWPWTVNAEGDGSFYDDKAQAIAAVHALQARGVRSIDVGCMQVNLTHHPNAFASLEQAFDPTANADYAAQFLAELRAQAGSWPAAAALYHSATPQLAAAYQQKVMQAWAQEQRLGSPNMLVAHAPGGVLTRLLFPPPLHAASHNAPAMALPPGSSPGPSGRGLAAYRSAPIQPGWRRNRS